MKCRSDFVTNSSSSSFILGKAGQNTVTVSDGRKYLKKLKESLGLDQDVYCEHYIDLRYDPNKQYDIEDVQFVVEVIGLYSWEEERDKLIEQGEDEYAANGVSSLVTDDGEWFELNAYAESYTSGQIKAIYDYAYQHYGEVLLGNVERGFLPYEAYYDGIAHDSNIEYKCNHMGQVFKLLRNY